MHISKIKGYMWTIALLILQQIWVGCTSVYLLIVTLHKKAMHNVLDINLRYRPK